MRPVGLLGPALAATMLLVALTRIVILLRDVRLLEVERTLRAHAEAAHEELSRQEAQNRALVARLAGLLDAAPVGIIEGDLDGRITRWNAAAERIYGWTEAEARGTPLPRAVREDDGSGPERHRRKDGTTVDVEIATAELRDDAGRTTGWIEVVSDVSRRIELEVLLRHAQKMESIGHLAAGVAHEINTPIQFIGDNVRFIEEAFGDLARLCAAQARAIAVPDDPARREDAAAVVRRLADSIDLGYLLEEAPAAARQARDGIDTIATIVRAMKAFGQPGEVQRSPSDLNACIRNACVLASNELKQVATVELDLGELPPVLSHPDDLHQIMLNLLVNAAHAVAEVKTERGVGVVRVTSRREGDDVVIEVFDDGVGISPAVADKIFDPFFTTKPVGVGSGQGLALTRTLVVERHGGTIDFRSTPQDGTTFVVRLPIGRPS